jgi:hypothetical protein
MGSKNIRLISGGIKSISASIYVTYSTWQVEQHWLCGLVGATVFCEVKRGAIKVWRRHKSI